MTGSSTLRRLLFFVIYVPFAAAMFAYVITQGAIGKDAMVELTDENPPEVPKG